MRGGPYSPDRDQTALKGPSFLEWDAVHWSRVTKEEQEMTEVFRFHDQALDELVQRCTPSFQNFQTNLDQTSTDIKNLEKWLQSSGICFYTSVQIEGGYIAWSNQTGDWRLVLEGLPEEEYGEPICKPLIETPVKVRLAARRHLVTLVSQIASLVPPNPVELEKKKVSLFKGTHKNSGTKPEELDLFGDLEGV